jgi:hypothetical protein
MYICTHGILFNLRMKEILPFAATWMNLEDITLSKISQTQKDKCSHLCVESKDIELIEIE